MTNQKSWHRGGKSKSANTHLPSTMPSEKLKDMSDKAPQTGLSAKVEKKRKRQAEEPTKDKSVPAQKDSKPPAEGPSKKKQKKGKNNKPQQKQKQEQTDKGKPQETNKPAREHAVDESIAMMDGRLLADHLAQKARKLNKELTAMELDDLCVSGMSAMLHSGSWFPSKWY